MEEMDSFKSNNYYENYYCSRERYFLMTRYKFNNLHTTQVQDGRIYDKNLFRFIFYFTILYYFFFFVVNHRVSGNYVSSSFTLW